MVLNIVSVLTNYDGSDINAYFHDMVSPYVRVRQFPNNPKLFLVCNNHDITSDSILYKECRSFVISKEETTLNLVSYTHESITNTNVTNFIVTESDTYEEILEGTSVTAFCFESQWYFGTSRCTDIDQSFFNPEYSFGAMFDECIFPETRAEFSKKLDETLCYEFIIVHHKNKHVSDYSERFGPNYAVLLTSIVNCCENWKINVVSMNDLDVYPTQKPQKVTFNPETLERNVMCIRLDLERNTYEYYNVQNIEYELQCKRKPNYSNEYLCLLQIYSNNDKAYSINNYIDEFNLSHMRTLNINGKKYDWIGVFYVLYQQTGQILVKILLHFTEFDFDTHTFIKKNLDKYELIKSHEHSSLRRCISTLQNMFRVQKIKTVNHVTNYLRTYLSIREFVHIIKSIKTLENNHIFSHKHSYYSLYRDTFLSHTL